MATPDMTMGMHWKNNLPITQPRVVAMIQKKKSAQSSDFACASFMMATTFGSNRALFHSSCLPNAGLSLDRTGQHSADEVTLQPEEDCQGQDHRHKGAGGKQVPVLAACTHNGGHALGHQLILGIATQEDESHQVIVPYP